MTSLTEHPYPTRPAAEVDPTGTFDRAYLEVAGMSETELSPHREHPTGTPAPSSGGAEPVAWWVHDFHVARQPVKAKGKFPEAMEYLYPAHREHDAKSAAKVLGATCSPLYSHPSPSGVNAEVVAALEAVREDALWNDVLNEPNSGRAHLVDQVDAALHHARSALQAQTAASGAGEWRSQAAHDVLAERTRQVEAEGWTPEHDDGHADGELADAAACYARDHGTAFRTHPPKSWPWHRDWWKPKDRRIDLVRAAALLVAEIERLDRAASPSGVNAEVQPVAWRYSPFGVRVKPLEWIETRALNRGRKLAAHTCFGDEFARLDLKDQSGDEIEAFKAREQLNYEHHILSALEPSAPAVDEVQESAEPMAWMANCCRCGRIVDTREKSQGGDDFGCEIEGGRWTCSIECWDAAVGHPSPTLTEPTEEK